MFLNQHWKSETKTKQKMLIVPRHYLEEYASLLGKTYWELLDEIKKEIVPPKETE